MPITLSECIRSFIFYCVYERTLSRKSVKAYQIDLNQFTTFIDQKCKAMTINLIDKVALREYVKLLFSEFSPKTIKRKIATLKAFFSYLEFEDTIATNPFRKLKVKIKEGNQLPKTISLPKIVNLFKYVYNLKNSLPCVQCYAYKTTVRDIAVLELLFVTGIRVAELCNLKEADVDILKGSIKVIGKGNKERIVPVCSSDTIDAVKGYYELFKNEILKSKYFFVNRRNNRLSEQSVRFMIKKYCKAIKIHDNITPHMFRHSIATLLLEAGVDIRYIQLFLGHSSIMTTQIYVHVNEESQRKILLDKHPREGMLVNRVKTNEG
jgi:integrase/recombinase XerD